MRALIFAKRNFKEITREPLNFILALGIPVFMLVLFAVLQSFIPEGQFEADWLTAGICVFSISFDMLFVALLFSKDRSGEFLNRLFTSSMKGRDYIIGYFIPNFIVAIIQLFICVLVSWLIAVVSGQNYNVLAHFASIVTTIPAIVCFLSMGMIFGAILSDKQAPGISSMIISVSSVLSGAWMPIESMGSFQTFCKVLPFYAAVYPNRTLALNIGVTFENFWLGILTESIYAVVFFALAIVVFNVAKKADK